MTRWIDVIAPEARPSLDVWLYTNELTLMLRHAVAGQPKWRSEAVRLLHRIDAGEIPEPAAPAPRHTLEAGR